MNVQWARQYMVWEGLLDSPRRGVWTLTPKGAATHLSVADGQKIFVKWTKLHGAQRKTASDGAATITPPSADGDLPEGEEEEIELLGVLQSLAGRF